MPVELICSQAYLFLDITIINPFNIIEFVYKKWRNRIH